MKSDHHKPLPILSDCSAAIMKVKDIVANKCVFYTHARDPLPLNIHTHLGQRTSPTYINHIRSHVGFVENEWADIFAKGGHTSPFSPPKILTL